MNHSLYSHLIQLYQISKHQNELFFQQQFDENEIYQKFQHLSNKVLIKIDSISVFQTSNGNLSNSEMHFHFDHDHLIDDDEMKKVGDQNDESLHEEKELLIYFPKWLYYCLFASQEYEILDHYHFCFVRVKNTFFTQRQKTLIFKYSSFLMIKNINGKYKFTIEFPLFENTHNNINLQLVMISAHAFEKMILINGELYDENKMKDNSEFDIVEVNEILYKKVEIKNKENVFNLLKKKSEIIIGVEAHLLISSILCDEKMSPFLLDESKSFANLSSKRTDYFGGFLNIYNQHNLIQHQIEGNNAKEKENVIQELTKCIFIMDFMNIDSNEKETNEKLQKMKFVLELIQNEFKENEVTVIFRIKQKEMYYIKNNKDDLIDLFYILLQKHNITTTIDIPQTKEIEMIENLNKLNKELVMKEFIEKEMNNQKHFEIVYFTQNFINCADVLTLLMQGNSISYFSFIPQHHLNVFYSLEINMFDEDLTNENIQNELIKLKMKYKMNEIKFNDSTVTIDFHYPFFSLEKRKTVLFLTSSYDVHSIHFDNLQAKRNAFSCIHSIEYLYSQTMNWKVKNDPKITAKTIMRQIKLNMAGPKRGSVAAVKRGMMTKQISPLDSLNHIDPSLMNQKVDSINIMREMNLNTNINTIDQRSSKENIQINEVEKEKIELKLKGNDSKENLISEMPIQKEESSEVKETKVAKRSVARTATVPRKLLNQQQNLDSNSLQNLNLPTKQTTQKIATERPVKKQVILNSPAGENINLANIDLSQLNLSEQTKTPTTGRAPPVRKKMTRSVGVGDFRNQRMLQFKNVLQQTNSDKTGLENILVEDIEDRLIHQLHTKYSEQNSNNVLLNFKEIGKKIYENEKWIEMSKTIENKSYIEISKIDSVVSSLNDEKIEELKKSITTPMNTISIEPKRKISRSAHIGPKTRMEDYDYYVEDLRIYNNQITEKITYIGVYDGHVGPACADYCTFKLHNEILRNENFPTDMKKVLADSINNVENNYKLISKSFSYNAGTTAGIIMITEQHIFTANLGDTEIVLSRKTKPFEILSSKHTCTNLDEKKRIEQAGGHIRFNNGDRVEGVLLVTRSIGDEGLKNCVTCEPSLFETKLDGDEEFIICATDGMWDVFDHGDVVLLVKELMKSNLNENEGKVDKLDVQLPKSLEDISRYLVDLSLKKGSKDNVTVTICFF